MKLTFVDEKTELYFTDLNRVIGSKELMQKKIGLKLTKAVQKRCNQLKSYVTFFELVTGGVGKPESLSHDLKGFYSLRLTANYRLIIKPNSIDLSPESLKKCDSIMIRGVVDYHDRKNKYSWIIP